MRILNFTIIKLTSFLIIGILISGFYQIELDLVVGIVIFLISIIGLLFILLKKRYDYHFLIDFLQCVGFIVIGIIITIIQKDSFHKNHYTKQIHISSSPQIIDAQFYIKNVLKSGLYNDRYIVELEFLNHKPSNGKLLLNIERDSNCEALQIGQRFFSSLEVKPIAKALNPGTFDYAKYMSNQEVYCQSNISLGRCFPLEKDHNGFLTRVAAFRSHLQSKITFFDFDSDEYAIVNALLLGQRQDISNELRTRFANAGAIHILAVSGLHIGIILLMFQRILSPLNYFRKGRLIKTIIIVLLLWNYAALAGLSASIVRATTMFTVIAIAMNLKRPTNVINTLFISIFFILLCQPKFIYDVGFQLSYTAVFGIVLIEPIIRSLWKPRIKIVEYFWQIFTVSLAAQVGVLPLSLYYFHQFPGLFFLTNLVIIPSLSLILGIGFIILALSLMDLLPLVLIECYQFCLKSMNSFVKWVASKEEFIFHDVVISKLEVLLLYFFIGSLLWIFYRKSFKSILSFLMVILTYQCTIIFDSIQPPESRFVIFHKSRHTVLGYEFGNSMEIHHSMKSEHIQNESFLKNYKMAQQISDCKMNELNSIYKIDNKYLLLIDSAGIYNLNNLKPEMILLRNSPRINLERLIEELQPELIIADGSNYTSFQTSWEDTCIAKKIPFYRTSKKGAFIYRY